MLSRCKYELRNYSSDSSQLD